MTWIGEVGLVVAAIGGAATWYWKYRTERAKAKAAEDKIDDLNSQLKDASASIVVSVEGINAVKDLVEMMFKETTADRFLILAARNGKESPNRTTAVYEQHKSTGFANISIGASHRYVDFRLDNEYKKMLKRAENLGAVWMNTKEMEDSELRRIYQYEEVESSSIHFLMRTPIDQDNDRLWYCSVATHSEAGFTESQKTLIAGYVGNIRKHMASFA